MPQMLFAVQTGLRLSELTGLRREDIRLDTGAHVHVIGKGRKERCTPLARQTCDALATWMKRELGADVPVLFPSARGGRMSADAAQYLVAKHAAIAGKTCPSLTRKRVTPHVLRHYLPTLTISGTCRTDWRSAHPHRILST